MNWNDVWKIVLTCITSVGGIGAIIVGVIKWSSTIIADRLSKKYQLQVDIEKERLKTELNKKEYVSKTRFEAEFRMYQELSEKNISMVFCAGESVIIARGAPYSNQEIEQFIEEYCNRLNDAMITNRKYAPFIEKEMYEKYISLEKKASELYRLIKVWKQYQTCAEFNFKLADTVYHNHKEIKTAIEEKQKIISAESDSILTDLRDYLNKLDVLED